MKQERQLIIDQDRAIALLRIAEYQAVAIYAVVSFQSLKKINPMEPVSLPSLDYLFSNPNKSRRGESYFTLGDTIDMAIDLELHANFLLEEALQKSAQENPGKVSNGPSYSKDMTSMNDSGVSRRRQEDSRPPRYPSSGDFPAAVIEVPLSRSNSGTNKRERDSEKEPYSFASARDTFIDEGGVFKRKKEDYKPVRNPSSSSSAKPNEDTALPPELAMHDKALVEKIESEIIHHGQPVRFDDISGLEFAKQCVEESVCW